MASPMRPSSIGRVLVVASLMAGLLTVAGVVLLRRPRSSGSPLVWRTPGGPAYVGDKQCAGCHREIVTSYRTHPMGRSIAPIESSASLGPEPARFEAGRLLYESERRDGQLFHRETLRDENEAALGQVEGRVRFALGSGTRGVSYLVEREVGGLVQSPISWYSQGRKWDLAPGYRDGSNQHFERPILPECLFCHADRAEAVPGSLNRYRVETVGHAIGCERCHGPAEDHVRLAGATDIGGRATIVNPGALEPHLREAVCEQCHLQGEARVIRAGRSLDEFRPGRPLDEVLSVYVRPGGGSLRNRSIGHVEQMHASRCYQATQGKLGCISCHDPHRQPAETEKIAYYRDRCLSCHADQGCSLPEPPRRERQDDCVACHMPRSKLIDIAHTASTLHHIPRSLEQLDAEPAPPEDERELVHFHEGQLSAEDRVATLRDLGVALAARGRNLPDRARAAQLGNQSMALLAEALRRRPEDPEGWESRAGAYFLVGRTGSALDALTEALRYEPDRERALVVAVSMASDLGRRELALRYAEHLLALNPSRASHHAILAVLLAQTRSWDGAVAAARAALALDPAQAEARRVLIEHDRAMGLPGQAGEQQHILDLYQAPGG